MAKAVDKSYASPKCVTRSAWPNPSKGSWEEHFGIPIELRRLVLSPRAVSLELCGQRVTVDLAEQTVHAKDLTVAFTIDRYTRWRLLEGLDDIALSLRHAQEIDAFEAHRPSWLPTTTVG